MTKYHKLFNPDQDWYMRNNSDVKGWWDVGGNLSDGSAHGTVENTTLGA